ncbi:hypothetical protein [Tunicatimonas pelagia]|uniref:hypothetical protein n=1 Tax=Tunicatimonas pelagia TaxID=931531 RepID=UPI00266666E0|nr:hypothetical protein [Tunicatimonas pelagia]WKN43786.1 hypothetical protein P0M28_02215 [Tunicatimonas pelagia]
MGSDTIFIREYLESLKEDSELDYLFPILLNVMGFRIITTPKESKGQSQYGKDVIAVGKDVEGTKYRFYFELKGYQDRDINDKNYSATDGIRESIIEAKDTAFSDSSIPEFNHLPVKIVLVHNGLLKANIRPTFEGFISKEFEEGQFERWDIYHLTDLFGKYLFNEYLFTDDQSLRLFKKTLVLLDVPENDYRDFKQLVDLQIDKIGEIKKGRAFTKFFATQNLLASVVLHYSEENLEAAKQCLTYLLLKTWAWILESNLDQKPSVQREFAKLISIHYKMLDSYFSRSLDVAKLENGLFSERGGPFEEVGYPLRSFEYLNYLVYFFRARLYFSSFTRDSSKAKEIMLRRKQKDTLIELIENNDGCSRPLMDYHSIAVLNVILFFWQEEDLEQKDVQFVVKYLHRLVENIVIVYSTRKRFPFIGDEIGFVKNIQKTRKKGESKRQPSSLLITILFELAAILDFEQLHENYKEQFEGKVNLQTAYPRFNEYDIEKLLFEQHLVDEFYVETNIELMPNLAEFKEVMSKKEIEKIDYRTNEAGFPFLRALAHAYFKNEFFVDEWRRFYSSESTEENSN